MAHYIKVTKVPVAVKGQDQATVTSEATTFRLTREYTSPRLFDRCVNRVLSTYMDGAECRQVGSVDWDRHWILVGRVAVSTNQVGQHYLNTFPDQEVANEYLDVIEAAYQGWLEDDQEDEYDEFVIDQVTGHFTKVAAS